MVHRPLRRAVPPRRPPRVEQERYESLVAPASQCPLSPCSLASSCDRTCSFLFKGYVSFGECHIGIFDMDFGYAGELEHFAFHDDPLFYRLGCAGNDSHHPHCTYST